MAHPGIGNPDLLDKFVITCEHRLSEEAMKLFPLTFLAERDLRNALRYAKGLVAFHKAAV